MDSTSAFPQINFSVVVHGRMQALPREGQLWGGGVCQAFARRVRGYASPPKKILNGAIWCVLEHIFIIFLLSKINIMINCSHVLARGSRSMIHCPLIIFIKGCNFCNVFDTILTSIFFINIHFLFKK